MPKANRGTKAKLGAHKNWRPKGIDPLKVTALLNAYFKNGFNKTKALEEAGWKWSNNNLGQVWEHPQVLTELKRRQDASAKKFEVTEKEVLEGLTRIARAPEILAKYLVETPNGGLRYDFTGITNEDKACITALQVKDYVKGRGDDKETVTETKLVQSDPKAAWDSLARHFGMFNDKLAVNGEVTLVERLQKGRDRMRARNAAKKSG